MQVSQPAAINRGFDKEIDGGSNTIPQLDPLFPAPPRLWGVDSSSFSNSVLIFRAITILTDYMRSVKMIFVDPYDETKEAKPRATDAMAALLNRPNSIMDSATFRELLTGYEQYHGGYIVALVGASGEPIRKDEEPVAMLPYPIKDWRRITSDGSKDFFKGIGWARSRGAVVLYDHQCIVSRTLDVSGRFGVVSPAQVVSDAATTQSEIDAYQSNLLRNNGRPGIVISTPTHVKKPLRDRFMAEWQQNHGGPENAGRPAFLTDADWKINPIESLKLGDITSENQFRDSVRKVGMAFKIPEMEFGITENVHKESSAQVRAMFLTGTIESMFRAWESVWNFQFCDRFGLPYRVRLDQWGLSAFRDVMAVRLSLVKQYIESGVMIRDAYKLVGVPFTDNDQMGRAFLPSTLTELVPAKSEPVATPAPESRKPDGKKPSVDDDHSIEEEPIEQEPKPAKAARTVIDRSATKSVLSRIKELGDKKRKALGAAIWNRCVKPFEEPVAEGTTKAMKRQKGYFLKRLNHYLNTGEHLDEESRTAKDLSVFVEFKAEGSIFLPGPTDLEKMLMPKDEAVAGLQAAWRMIFAEVEAETVRQMADEIGELSGWLSQPPEQHRAISLARLGDAIKVDDTTRAQIKTTLTRVLEETPDAQPVQIARALREEASHVFNNAFARANTIARTEVGAVMGDYRAAVMAAEGVKTKRWISAHDPHVRPTHAAAEKEGAILMANKFDSTNMMRPHDPEGSASEVINCRCVLVAG